VIVLFKGCADDNEVVLDAVRNDESPGLIGYTIGALFFFNVADFGC